MAASDAALRRLAREIREALNGRVEERHALELARSAISPAVAALRGYRTIDLKSRTEMIIAYQFADSQARVPGLLIPRFDVHGQPNGAQYKPDSSRTRSDGKGIIKYEVPAGSRLIIDVPPICQPDLGNPRIDLWIDEGVKKADSLASQDLTACAIAIAGIWASRGLKDDGGSTALPDWESIALNDNRRIFITLDGDITSNARVKAGADRLSRF